MSAEKEIELPLTPEQHFRRGEAHLRQAGHLATEGSYSAAHAWATIGQCHFTAANSASALGTFEALKQHMSAESTAGTEALKLAKTPANILQAKALREMADRIDRGPESPLPPSVISALVRERADDIERGGPS